MASTLIYRLSCPSWALSLRRNPKNCADVGLELMSVRTGESEMLTMMVEEELVEMAVPPLRHPQMDFAQSHGGLWIELGLRPASVGAVPIGNQSRHKQLSHAVLPCRVPLFFRDQEFYYTGLPKIETALYISFSLQDQKDQKSRKHAAVPEAFHLQKHVESVTQHFG